MTENIISIFDPKGMAKSMRHTEYKSIVSAISELVDNSIEAKATNILIYLVVKQDDEKPIIDQVYVVDNGTGMDHKVLHECLVFGKTNSTETSIIGKFGVGLGQAALFSAPRVNVYSWQGDIEKSEYVYLDTDEMIKGAQIGIEEPKPLKLPKVLREYLNTSTSLNNMDCFREHGTCVYLDGVDKFEYKRVVRNVEQIKDELARRFRYFLQENVKITVVTNETGMRVGNNYYQASWIGNIREEEIHPMDPLFVMNESRIKGYSNSIEARIITKNEPLYEESDNLFEIFVNYGDKSKFDKYGVYRYEINYITDNKELVNFELEIKASVVNNKFYYGQPGLKKSPGDTPIGKTLKEYTGISFLRSKREIEYGNFNIYEEVNTPVHRWWGLEVNFTPAADKFFQLSNNKQHIIIPKAKVLKNNTENEKDYESFEQAWIDLLDFLNNIIKGMMKRNKGLVPSERSSKKNPVDPVANPFDITNVKKGNTDSGLEHIIDDLFKTDKSKKNKSLKHEIDYDKFNDLSNKIKIQKEDSDDLLLCKFIDGKYQIILNQSNLYFNYYYNDKSFMKSFEILEGALYTYLYDNYNPGNVSFVRGFIQYLNNEFMEKGGVIDE